MFDWQQVLDSDTVQRLILLGTGVGVAVGAFWAAMRGIVKGKPTSTAVAAAIANANCQARDLGPVFERIRADIAELRESVTEVHEEIEQLHDLLIRIEDRTRAGRR